MHSTPNKMELCASSIKMVNLWLVHSSAQIKWYWALKRTKFDRHILCQIPMTCCSKGSTKEENNYHQAPWHQWQDATVLCTNGNSMHLDINFFLISEQVNRHKFEVFLVSKFHSRCFWWSPHCTLRLLILNFYELPKLLYPVCQTLLPGEHESGSKWRTVLFFFGRGMLGKLNDSFFKFIWPRLCNLQMVLFQSVSSCVCFPFCVLSVGLKAVLNSLLFLERNHKEETALIFYCCDFLCCLFLFVSFQNNWNHGSVCNGNFDVPCSVCLGWRILQH